MKTSELTGAALDWAVAKCEFAMYAEQGDPIKPWVQQRHNEGDPCMSPSTNWAQGGPIIEREKISLTHHADEPDVTAYIGIEIVGGDIMNWKAQALGPTPLIAAMRCYVASRLGDEVDVPAELS